MKSEAFRSMMHGCLTIAVAELLEICFAALAVIVIVLAAIASLS